MATPNYGYEKRQRELAKKKKKEEKLRAKTTGAPVRQSGTYVAPEDATETTGVLPAPPDSSIQPG